MNKEEKIIRGWWWKRQRRGFDPTTFNVANNMAIYDGAVGLTNATWADSSGNARTLTWNQTPSVISGGLNGYDTIRLNGTNQNGFNVTFTSGNNLTIYLVVKQITWTFGDAIWANGSTSLNLSNLRQSPSGQSPKLNLIGASGNTGVLVPDLSLNTWGIITVQITPTTGLIRLNGGTPVTVSGMVNDSGNGILLGARTPATTGWWNGEYAYVVLRNGIDALPIVDQYVLFFKNRFGIV